MGRKKKAFHSHLLSKRKKNMIVIITRAHGLIFYQNKYIHQWLSYLQLSDEAQRWSLWAGPDLRAFGREATSHPLPFIRLFLICTGRKIPSIERTFTPCLRTRHTWQQGAINLTSKSSWSRWKRTVNQWFLTFRARLADNGKCVTPEHVYRASINYTHVPLHT